MGRAVLAALAGLVTMGIAVFLIEGLGHLLYPLPPGTDLSDPDTQRRLVAMVPGPAKAFVVGAWAVGSFIGAWVAARLATAHRRGAALTVGAVMVVLVAVNVSTIPHPVWMVAAGLILPIPLALAALRLARR